MTEGVKYRRRIGMLWLIRKLLMLAVFAALVWLILQLDYKGRPVKDYANEFLQAPLVREIVRQGKGLAAGYLKKDLKEESPAMEEVGEEERRELEKVLEEESKRP